MDAVADWLHWLMLGGYGCSVRLCSVRCRLCGRRPARPCCSGGRRPATGADLERLRAAAGGFAKLPTHLALVLDCGEEASGKVGGGLPAAGLPHWVLVGLAV